MLTQGTRQGLRVMAPFRSRRACARAWLSSSATPPGDYQFKDVEKKWQAKWLEAQQSRSVEADELELQADGADGAERESAYVLSMFPYPSGNLHMGHVRVYTISDCLSRFNKMKGKKVLHPMGWDAFGLPAENAAIERGINPAEWTDSNIGSMKQQLSALGFDFDWHREVATCKPSFYRWTQWLFLLMHRSGLAYSKDAYVNWDPVDMTVVANEQVDDEGRSWRSGALVERKLLKQWFLKITEFANELDSDLNTLTDWPDKVKSLQRHWIGKSEGALVDFQLQLPTAGRVPEPLQKLTVFTTRADTLFGVSYLVLAPEHPLVEAALRDGLIDQQYHGAINDLCKQLSSTSNVKRQCMEKIGVPTGLCAAHPLSGQPVPLFLSAYVLPDVGTGAVMGVPAHDTRDWDFAKLNNLPVKFVVQPVARKLSSKKAKAKATAADMSPTEGPRAITGEGVLIDSGEYTGMTTEAARALMVQKLEAAGRGKLHTHFRLNDWLVSRQRYWGTPIPMIHCGACGAVPVPEADLPVVLPAMPTLETRGNPLASEAARAWREVPCPSCGQPSERDTDTLDTFVDSSWYFFRYVTPTLTDKAFDVDLVNQRMPVDVYVGGVEHAILHLLYARFITKVMHSKGLVQASEPFKRLLNQGMVHGETFKDPAGRFVRREHVTMIDGEPHHVSGEHKQKLNTVWEKMSKSKHNGIDPSEVLAAKGADAARLFVLFAAPPEKVLDWNTSDITGQSRFLRRMWVLLEGHVHHADLQAELALAEPREVCPEAKKLRASVASAIKQVTETMNEYSFNSAISGLHVLGNALYTASANHPQLVATQTYHQALRTLVLLSAPMAPHIAAEAWVALLQADQHGRWGLEAMHADVHRNAWPTYDPVDIVAVTMPLVLQVKGKMKATFDLPMEQAKDREHVLSLLQGHEEWSRWLQGKEARKIIHVVDDKRKTVIVNVVV